MTLVEAIILGIVQGLTEFLPISSTAHLRIAYAMMGLSDESGAAFTAVIQLGTLVAVLLYFARDVVQILRAVVQGLISRRPLGTPEAQLGWMIAAGTVPIVVFGLAFKDQIETTLRSLYVISATLIFVALLMEVAEEVMVQRLRAHQTPKELGQVSWRDAMWIGAAQTLALIPGVSRSGITITAGLFRNLSRPTAARFSFLLSLPSIFGAGMLQLVSSRDRLASTTDDIVNLVVATIVSGVVGYLAIAFLLHYLRTRTTRVFVVYRIALGVFLIALLLADRLAAN